MTPLAISLVLAVGVALASWNHWHRSERIALRRSRAVLACTMVGLLAACSSSGGSADVALSSSSASATGATDASSSTTGTTAGSSDAATSSSDGFVLSEETHADTDDGDYDEAGATTIALANGSSKVNGPGASVKGDVVTITAAGTYLVSGTLSNGQVVVNSTGEGKVDLVLAGVDITSSATSPVVVTAADEAIVILAEGSVNTLTDSVASAADDEAEDAPTATLFSMADLTIAGTGTLNVTGASNDAIASKDGLVVLSGTISVKAVDDGVRGKDYLVIEGGTIDVTAGGDGLKSDNDTAGELGWIRLDAGTVAVSAGSQGADAVGAIDIADGVLTIARSAEGLQAATIAITGGAVAVVASDDGLNGTTHTVAGGGEQAETGVVVTISGGGVTIAAGSDGIDSNGSATITGGVVAISAQSGGGGNGPLDVNGTLDAPGVLTIAANAIKAGQHVTLTDASGAPVASFVALSTTSSLVVAGSGIESGMSYTVYSGDSTSTTSVEGLTKIATVTATAAGQTSTGPGGARGQRTMAGG